MCGYAGHFGSVVYWATSFTRSPCCRPLRTVTSPRRHPRIVIRLGRRQRLKVRSKFKVSRYANDGRRPAAAAPGTPDAATAAEDNASTRDMIQAFMAAHVAPPVDHLDIDALKKRGARTVKPDGLPERRLISDFALFMTKLSAADKSGMIKAAWAYTTGEQVEDVPNEHKLAIMNALASFTDGEALSKIMTSE